VLVRTGYGREQEGDAAAGPAPDRVFDDLAGAVAWFLARETPAA
jgi:hypothetical protein